MNNKIDCLVRVGLAVGTAVFGAHAMRGQAEAEVAVEPIEDCVPFEVAANIVYVPIYWDENGRGGDGNFESIFAQKSQPGEKGYVDESGVRRSYSMWDAENGRWYTDEELRRMGVDPMITFDQGVGVDGYSVTTTTREVILPDGTVIFPITSCYSPLN